MEPVLLKHWPRPISGGRGGATPRTLCGLSSRYHRDMYAETEATVNCPRCRKRMTKTESALPQYSLGKTQSGKYVPVTGVPHGWSEDDYADAAEVHYKQGREQDRLARHAPGKDHGTQAEYHYRMARTLLKHAGLSESAVEETMTLLNNTIKLPLRKSVGWRGNRAVDTDRVRNAELNHSVNQAVGKHPDTAQTNVGKATDDVVHNVGVDAGNDPNVPHLPHQLRDDDMLRVGEGGVKPNVHIRKGNGFWCAVNTQAKHITLLRGRSYDSVRSKAIKAGHAIIPEEQKNESGLDGMDPTKKFHVVDWDRFARGGMNRTAMRATGLGRYAVIDTTRLPISHASMAVTRKKIIHSTDTREHADKIAADLNSENGSAKGTHEAEVKEVFDPSKGRFHVVDWNFMPKPKRAARDSIQAVGAPRYSAFEAPSNKAIGIKVADAIVSSHPTYKSAMAMTDKMNAAHKKKMGEEHNPPPNPKPVLRGAGGQPKPGGEMAQDNYVGDLAQKKMPTPNKKPMPHLERLQTTLRMLKERIDPAEGDEYPWQPTIAEELEFVGEDKPNHYVLSVDPSQSHAVDSAQGHKCKGCGNPIHTDGSSFFIPSHCPSCEHKMDKGLESEMMKKGHAGGWPLYHTGLKRENTGTFDSRTGRGHQRTVDTGSISTFHGHAKWKVTDMKIGAHNMARNQTHLYWTMPDGSKWHGVNVGDNQLVRGAKRLKNQK